MNYENIIENLLIDIPEITIHYKKEMEIWEEYPGHHNIFGDVVNPFIINALVSEHDKKLLKRIFEFLEKMANSNSIEIQEVLTLTVLERLGDNKKILRKAYKYMGSKTRKYSKEVEAWLGRK